jgi:hypothetical protein
MAGNGKKSKNEPDVLLGDREWKKLFFWSVVSFGSENVLNETNTRKERTNLYFR